MAKPLPSKLGHPPVVEATCELRVKSSTPLHTVLPGYLIAKLGSDLGKLEQLPSMQIPPNVRALEPSLAAAHLMRMAWKGHYVHFGDAVISLTSRHPYPGWAIFQQDVVDLFATVLSDSIVEGIERYSVKYANLFYGQCGISPHEAFNWSLRVGEIQVTDENCQLRIEVPSNEFLTILMIASSATVNHAVLGHRVGAIVDVDVLCHYVTDDIATFRTELTMRFDAVKQHNKSTFFNVLKDSTIVALEPEYD